MNELEDTRTFTPLDEREEIRSENADGATRPSEPDHPMALEGEIVAGDTEFMMRCFFDEYLREGYSAEELWSMCGRRHYQALYAGREVLGDERTRALIERATRSVQGLRYRIRERGVDGCDDPAIAESSTSNNGSRVQ